MRRLIKVLMTRSQSGVDAETHFRCRESYDEESLLLLARRGFSVREIATAARKKSFTTTSHLHGNGPMPFPQHNPARLWRWAIVNGAPEFLRTPERRSGLEGRPPMIKGRPGRKTMEQLHDT